MPTKLSESALPVISGVFAKYGMNLLSGFFKGSMNSEMQKVADTINENTGIEITVITESKLTDEQLVKLKEFELQNEQLLMTQLKVKGEQEIELEKLFVQDRASARDMQKAALSQDDKFSKRFIYYYSIGITALTFSYIFYVSFHEIPDKNRDMVNTILGFLLGVSLSAIIQFFFGSSKGSADKQQAINDLASQVSELSTRLKNK